MAGQQKGTLVLNNPTANVSFSIAGEAVVIGNYLKTSDGNYLTDSNSNKLTYLTT